MAAMQAFPLPFEGLVALKKPEVSVWVLLDYSPPPCPLLAPEIGPPQSRVEKGDYLAGHGRHARGGPSSQSVSEMGDVEWSYNNMI